VSQHSPFGRQEGVQGETIESLPLVLFWGRKAPVAPALRLTEPVGETLEGAFFSRKESPLEPHPPARVEHIPQSNACDWSNPPKPLSWQQKGTFNFQLPPNNSQCSRHR